jgi:hypothetical protein
MKPVAEAERTVEMGLPLGDADQDAFYAAALAELLHAAGAAPEKGATEVEEMGLPHDRRVIALARRIQNIAPWLADAATMLLPQAYAYLKYPHVRRAVDAVVSPALTSEPCIVVSHSLGTIVSYAILRKGSMPVAEYVTMGAPLALHPVRNAMGPPLKRPDCVARWTNLFDPDDFVSLGQPLDETTKWSGISNVGDVDNGDQDPHDYRKYLADPRVARAVIAGLDSLA